jgi:hypothetical protein
VATSPAFCSCSIGHADSPDRANHGFFCKKALPFFENQPVLHKLSQYILQKPPQFFSKSTRSLDQMGSWFFAKKILSFIKNQPAL